MELLTQKLNGKNAQISVCAMEQYSKAMAMASRQSYKYMESIIILQCVLSKQLSRERMSGIMNVVRALRSGSTLTEMQNAYVSVQRFKFIQIHLDSFRN